MPVGMFKPAGEDPASDRAAEAHDSEVYRQGVGFLTSGRAARDSSTTQGWLRRMNGVHARDAHRRAAQGKKGK